MARQCDLCAKRKQIGRQSRHKKGVAGKQWAKRAQKTTRLYQINLHPATVNGQRMILCAKCVKKLRREQKLAHEETSKAVTTA